MTKGPAQWLQKGTIMPIPACTTARVRRGIARWSQSSQDRHRASLLRPSAPSFSPSISIPQRIQPQTKGTSPSSGPVSHLFRSLSSVTLRNSEMRNTNPLPLTAPAWFNLELQRTRGLNKHHTGLTSRHFSQSAANTL
ncbi:unnamed protein product [Pleuronectes platessa]|uniref:Uncharacterized protein n=1 Tax=Pleuronectes platessa TaxID=8262 RepID=A0A9N7V7L2_PLEPL|nr:unnamed protein product [Pleuronectes platessa]